MLDTKAMLDEAGIVEQDAALQAAAGQAFYNTSRFTLRDLRARASRQQLKADFEAYLDGFSPSVQDILDNFEFRNQIPRLSKADALGTLEKLTSPDVNLGPEPVKNADGSVRLPGLDNHGMGTIFEELDGSRMSFLPPSARRRLQERHAELGRCQHPHRARQGAAAVMTSLMKDDTELFKQFMDNAGFKQWMTSAVFELACRQAGPPLHAASP